MDGAVDLLNPGEHELALRRALSGLVTPFRVVAEDGYVLTRGERVLADLSAGGRNWSMPAAALAGDMVTVLTDGHADTHPLLLDGNGAAFPDGGTLLLDRPRLRADLLFDGAMWRPLPDLGAIITLVEESDWPPSAEDVTSFRIYARVADEP